MAKREIGVLKHDKKEILRLMELAKDSACEVCVFGCGFIGREFGRQILFNYGIEIDYYCDNNTLLIGQEIKDGICCDSVDRLKNCKETTVCFLLVGIIDAISIYHQLKGMGIANIVTYEDLLDLDATVKQFFPFMNRKQIAIYTCITGGYDELMEPEIILDNCDYYFISDREPKKDTIYQWINVDKLVPDCICDNVLKNRYCKILPHMFFQEYRYSIYIDGNVTLRGNITECISKLGKSRIGVGAKQYTDSVYGETLRRLKNGLDNPDIFMKQAQKYWYEGMPDDFGTFWCNVLIREHNNPACKKLMEDWWKEFSKYSRRDQISFSYILWKNGYTDADVMTLFSLRDERYENPILANPYWTMPKKLHKAERSCKWMDKAKNI